MKPINILLLLMIVLLSSCSKYRITNSSTHPISLNINYEFKDSANLIPVQVDRFNKEIKNGSITNYKTSVSDLSGTISFDITSKKNSVVTFLIFAAHNVKSIKPNSNLTIQVMKQTTIVDTVYLIQNGRYVVNKFMKKVSPNFFYKRFSYYYKAKLE